MLDTLYRIRDRVLDGARIEGDDVVLDVGSGTGLMTVGALERLGENGEVIALDVSVDCLEELRAECSDARVSYLIGSAEALPLPDRFVDVVLTRSVLMYVGDKAEAAREFFRVLRPGGRASIREPVNCRCTQLWDVVDFGDLRERVIEDFDRCTPPDHPTRDFDVEDMVRWFGATGFYEVSTVVEQHQGTTRPESVLTEVPFPGSPRLVDAWRTSFTEGEIERLVAAVHAAKPITLGCPSLYLTAVKR